MNDMTFLCIIYDVTVVGGGGARSLSVTQGKPPVAIPPRTTRQYTCPFDRVINFAAPKLKADVAIQATFKTLGISRVSISDHFTWSALTGQWTEGVPLN